MEEVEEKNKAERSGNLQLKKKASLPINSSRGTRSRVSVSSSSSPHPTGRGSSSCGCGVVGLPSGHQLRGLDDGRHLVDGGERRGRELRAAGDAGRGGRLGVQRVDVAVCFVLFRAFLIALLIVVRQEGEAGRSPRTGGGGERGKGVRGDDASPPSSKARATGLHPPPPLDGRESKANSVAPPMSTFLLPINLALSFSYRERLLARERAIRRGGGAGPGKPRRGSAAWLFLIAPAARRRGRERRERRSVLSSESSFFLTRSSLERERRGEKTKGFWKRPLAFPYRSISFLLLLLRGCLPWIFPCHSGQ